MNNSGWTHWCDRRPPRGVLIQVTRDEWPKPILAMRESVHPHTNAWGLFWRLTGIGREQLEARA